MSDIIYSAVEDEMFFVAEALLDKYDDALDLYEMKRAFERLIESKGDHFLKGAQLFWPLVKHTIADYTMRNALYNAKNRDDQSMIEFLEICLKEKG